jgi:hypothetical protein
MAGRRQSQLRIAFSPLFKRQTTWDTPLASSELTKSFPATSRNWVEQDETVEDIYDCTGEDLLFELLTGRLARLTIDFDCDVNVLAGLSAFNYGVAASPSGGTNQVWTETITSATGGTYQIAFTHNYNRQVSAPLAFDADSAAIQTALQAMSNVGTGNMTVSGTGPFVITAAGALAHLILPNLEVISALTPGGATIAMVLTTPGVGRTHAISRLTTYQLPYMTVYVGFANAGSAQPVIFKNVVVDSLRVRATSRGQVTCTATLIGSGNLQDATGFTMPQCLDMEATRFGDCDLTINGQSLYDEASTWGVENGGVAVAYEWEYYHQNDVLTGAFAFTGRGVDVTRLQRNQRRPSGINIGAVGDNEDTLYTMAKQQTPRTIAAVTLRVGLAPRAVSFIVPQAILKLDRPGLRFEGDGNESHIRMIARPKIVPGDSSTPTHITAVTEQNTAFLVAA